MTKRRKGKKKKTCQTDIQEEQYKAAPHSFVFHRGHVGKNVKQLVSDTRTLMQPFTAKNLQVRKKNVLKDFVSVAGMLHVSHFIMFTKTDTCVYMRLCRLPRGPTLTFKIHDYCLNKDVISSLRKPNMEQIQYLHHPLLVMNNFTGEGNHVKLMATMFQNMFPSINVHKVKLNDVKRCVLVNYHPEDNMIDFRQYNIKVVPVGMSRGVKKLVQARVPNLGKYGDISEYVNRAGYSSESEVELDGPISEVILPQEIKSRGNIKSAKSAVRLTELGPRMRLELIKIEEGICDGSVMFHAFVTKTEAELAHLKAMRDKKKKVKEARRKHQESNIEKKKQDREDNKERSLAGIKRKLAEEGGDEDVEQPEMPDAEDDDDDREYYKKEVGRAPDADSLIPGANKRKKTQKAPEGGIKKQKLDKNNKGEKWSQKSGKDKKGGKQMDKNSNKNKNFKSNTRDNKDHKKSNSGGDTNNKKKTREGMTPLQRMMEKKKKKLKQKEKKSKIKNKGKKNPIKVKENKSTVKVKGKKKMK